MEQHAAFSNHLTFSLLRPKDFESCINSNTSFQPVKQKRVATKKNKAKIGVCFKCGTTQTPVFRKGPDGQQSLCNACGLYYASIIAKEKARAYQPKESWGIGNIINNTDTSHSIFPPGFIIVNKSCGS